MNAQKIIRIACRTVLLCIILAPFVFVFYIFQKDKANRDADVDRRLQTDSLQAAIDGFEKQFKFTASYGYPPATQTYGLPLKIDPARYEIYLKIRSYVLGRLRRRDFDKNVLAQWANEGPGSAPPYGFPGYSEYALPRTAATLDVAKTLASEKMSLTEYTSYSRATLWAIQDQKDTNVNAAHFLRLLDDRFTALEQSIELGYRYRVSGYIDWFLTDKHAHPDKQALDVIAPHEVEFMENPDAAATELFLKESIRAPYVWSS
ncbi:hypothetical protein BH09SUM1_BH09SUM1_10500 [soil metagenome]